MATPSAAKTPAKPASAKPDAKATPPKGARPKGAGAKGQAALPDAALLDREEGDTPEGVVAPAPGPWWMPKGPWRWVALGAMGLVVASGAAAAALVGFSRAPAKPAVVAGPAQAVSGATLVIQGETFRLEGVEAPPASLVCRDGKWEYPCGEESRRALEKEIRGRMVECRRAAAAQGAPASAQCHNDQGVDLAAALVEGGWAVLDFKRSSRYMPQQARAQSENRGLWRNDFALAEQWRLAGSKSR